MPGLYSHTTRSSGTVLTASTYNGDHQNHVDSHIPTLMDDYSSDVPEMKATTDPGEDGTESRATSLAGELERLRFIIAEITGKTQWYETPAADLASVVVNAIAAGTSGVSFPNVNADVTATDEELSHAIIGIGWPFPVFDNITGVEIPDNSGSVKYIKLTAGEDGAGQYNEGLLTSESVSGASPTITATAVISHAASPMDGQTVRLINTEERFLRAGNAGVTQDSEFESHDHGGSTGGNTANDIELKLSAVAASGAAVFSPTTGGTFENNLARDNTNHSHSVSSEGSIETRPRNVGITYYMRIA